MLSTFAFAPATAHPGNGSADASDGRIQGESYTGYASWCDPTSDGEHTRVNSADDADEGEYAFGPNSGCFFRFDDVTFDNWTSLPQYRVIAGCNADVTTEVTVRLYGERLHGKAVAQDSHQSRACVGEFHNATFDTSIRFPPGTYDILYSWKIVEGLETYNMKLDYLHVDTEPGPLGLTSDGVLEGELFDSDDPDCDPNWDGEHTVARQSTQASNGWYAFAGQSGCRITYEDVTFQEDATVESLRMKGPGCNALGVTTQVDVRVDGVLAASTVRTSNSPCAGFVTEPMRWSGTIPAGTHDITVSWQILTGFTWYNFNLDLIQFEFGGSLTDDTCRTVFSEHICNGVPT